jgi:membrane protein YdbS with pleckstrin-like domain
VTTASAAGPITIECLDKDVAKQLVADLTEYAARTEGDAT